MQTLVFQRNYCLHQRCFTGRLPCNLPTWTSQFLALHTSTLKTEAICCCETSAPAYRTTRYCNPQEGSNVWAGPQNFQILSSVLTKSSLKAVETDSASEALKFRQLQFVSCRIKVSLFQRKCYLRVPICIQPLHAESPSSYSSPSRSSSSSSTCYKRITSCM